MRETWARRVVIGAGLVLAAVSAPSASAHGNSAEAPPILERVSPEVEGLKVSVAYSANYQFVVDNPTGTELAVLAETGEPFLRIGPDGVFGNFASPAWYDSRTPEGLGSFPPQARPGADVPPDWRLISRQPSYGWFDHRLHPAERYVEEDIRRSKKPVTLGDPWTVPIRYGDVAGEISGRFEFQPVLGSYRSALRSSPAPAEGVTVQLSPSSTRSGVPALFVENASAGTVTVLGEAGEPFVRLGRVAEINTHSPTWQAIAEAQGRPVEEATVADARAEPAWKEVQATPKWGWPELRAAPPVGNPSEKITGADKPTTVRRWSVPILVGGERREIRGITEFVPISVAAGEISDEEEPEAGETPVKDAGKPPAGDGKNDKGDKGDEKKKGGDLGTAFLVSMTLWSIGLGIFFTRRRRAKLARARSTTAAARTPGPRPDRPGRRTRSTPKRRR